MSRLEKAALSVGAGILLALVFWVVSLVLDHFGGEEIGWAIAYGFARTAALTSLAGGVMGAFSAYSAKSGGGEDVE